MSSRPKVLIIGYVWPEPRSSAAGLRDISLIRIFESAGFEIHFCSPSKESSHSDALKERGISIRSIPANDPVFDAYIAELKPQYVVFDRFVTEEQFGWRVRENAPDAVRVLDTQDLHFLRRAREAALLTGASVKQIAELDFELRTDDSLREVAAIYRSDLTLVLSDFEYRVLIERFGVPKSLLALLPFCYDPPGVLAEPARSERRDFVMIGNFRHPPNADAVLWLKREIWPHLRKVLPQARVDIYGAYPPKEMMSLTDERTGFFVRGPAEDQYECLSKYRVNLAPLRFGAGIKGKIADGWSVGTPCVTTSIGSEGMGDSGPFGGIVADDVDAFVEGAVRLEESADAWDFARESGLRLLSERFSYEKNAPSILAQLALVQEQLSIRRIENFTGSMLWHHLHKSTTYFSRWIELKNKLSTARF